MGHDDIVVRVAFLKSDRSLLSAGWDGSVRKWSSARGTEGAVASLTHDSPVKSLYVDLEVLRGAAGFQNGLVKVFTLDSMRCIRNVQAHERDVSGVALLNTGRTLLTASWDGTCRVFELGRETTLVREIPVESRVRDLTVLPDGTGCLLGLHSGRVLRIDLSSGEASELGRHADAVVALTISPDGDLLATGGWDRMVRIWSLSSGECVARTRCVSGVTGLAWSGDGRSLYITSLAGILSRWDDPVSE